ncbi:MAG: hypothetical protein MK095_10325, partial [Phycisphaerales bacterium]|nr:hypothetical protein [Phycisphaerales bacterium]
MIGSVGLSPKISQEALATGHSWWWIIELSLVVALMACCAVSIGFIIRGRRIAGERRRSGLLWLVAGIGLMAGGGLMFIPDTSSAESAWITWVVAAAVFLAIVGMTGWWPGRSGPSRSDADGHDQQDAGLITQASNSNRQRRDRIFHAFCFSVTGLSVLSLIILLSAIGYLGWKYLSWDLLTSYA